ncbi:DinB family protein [uncultured Aquimarina sp.]|uniref:DinB family protein n=1 Tax=uncultured Aquimarina sp. TaxID=575652 RepID=UPI002620A14D|nr:DinB family protein [uncultured Aquimarina sp.]
MKNLFTKGIVIALIVITTISCTEQEVKTIEKEVIVEVSKGLDAKTLKLQYDLHANTFSKNLLDISDAEANKRVNNANSLVWIVGHTLDLQYNMAMLTGQTTENPYAEQFGFGKPFDAKAKYPSLSKMIKDWDALSPKISEALGKMNEELLNTKAPFPLPIEEQTMRGLFAFQMHHLGYEFGQIGLYRKFLGKSAFSY